MAEPDASSVENKIYSTYTSSKTQILTDIKNELLSPHARAMNDLPEDMKSYMNYIYSFLASVSAENDLFEPGNAWRLLVQFK